VNRRHGVPVYRAWEFGLSSVEELEDSVGTVAATVEPLQGVAEGVGRVSQRLSRR
jgi:hypothetical protein